MAEKMVSFFSLLAEAAACSAICLCDISVGTGIE